MAPALGTPSWPIDLSGDRTTVHRASTRRHPWRLPRGRTLHRMSHRLFTHTAAVGLAVAAVAAPVAAARPAQDLRSPDAADAARTALVRGHDNQAQDNRTPDARDVAQGRGTFT